MQCFLVAVVSTAGEWPSGYREYTVSQRRWSAPLRWRCFIKNWPDTAEALSRKIPLEVGFCNELEQNEKCRAAHAITD
jgi:hypothetical protein